MMLCTTENARVLVPITDVWFSSTLGTAQFAQVSFHNKPTSRDLLNLIRMLQLVHDSVFTDSAPQEPATGREGDYPESPAVAEPNGRTQQGTKTP